MSQRRRLDTGTLGIVAISARSGSEAAQVFAFLRWGNAAGVSIGMSSRHRHFEVRSRSGKVYAGVDGEALELSTPLEFQIYPRGLRLLVPDGNLTVAERRRARDISIGDLVAIARGVDPLVTSEP